MRSPTKTLLTSLLACTLVACGGDGGGGPVESGLPEDKTGDQLTTDEAETLCQAAGDNLASRVSEAQLKNYACVLSGIIFAGQGDGSVESCEKLVQMCNDGAGEDDGGEPAMCSLGFDTTTCTATVADIEACITEKNEALAEAIRSASCDDIKKEPGEPVTGPACTAVKANCPGIA